MKLHGEFRDLIVFMMMPIAELYAQELSYTSSGITLVEVFCTLPFSEIENVREAYRLINGISLEQDLKNQSSGGFKNFMSSFCSIDRNENDVDEAAADIDAKKLLSFGVSDIESDDSIFRQILLQRNIPQLKMIFQKYENISGYKIQFTIAQEFSGKSKNVILAIGNFYLISHKNIERIFEILNIGKKIFLTFFIEYLFPICIFNPP